MKNLKKITKQLTLLLTVMMAACTSTSSSSDTILTLNFEDNKVGAYTQNDVTNSIGTLKWAIFNNRAEVVKDKERGKVLKVIYPKGAIGPKEGGIQFDKPLEEANAYYLDYYIKFGEGFNFVKGGKLPGLTSGGETYTGGIHPDNGEGWSARYMWVDEGEIIVYFYHLDMKHKWGDAVRLHTKFQPGRWYRITQYIKINEADKFDGKMYVWIDGKNVLADDSVRYRIAPLGKINSFYFSTFFGGNTPDWAPTKDEAIFFDDMVVSKTKPKNLD